MENPLLIILGMADSNQPQMDKLQFMVLMVDDNIRMSVYELNYEGCLPHVTELEDDENEESPGDDDPSDDEYVSNTEDGIPSQDKS